ncbi:hypothetical protein [uncultured Ferrovibrio sp.]|jgi:hypothetical protein|uniref:hypothetical protein n=1 Tax=uncultured Ferrovibrio sp. TaxID=1576913 RepID=UPI00262AA2B9|nr:hypothetical protein [uncultured Ferrovibrio sp.]
MATIRSVPGARLVILLGILAAIVAGVAIAHGDQTSAVWAAAALFGAAAWLVKAGLGQMRQG